jgi:ApaG protein
MNPTFCRTQDIEVEVLVKHDTANSSPIQSRYVFVYNIWIRNFSTEAIQLISRHWKIRNGYGEVKNVDGLGVIGEQPTIGINCQFKYNSYCLLETPTGTMSGHYGVIQLSDNTFFEVKIPEFSLYYPGLSN